MKDKPAILIVEYGSHAFLFDELNSLFCKYRNIEFFTHKGNAGFLGDSPLRVIYTSKILFYIYLILIARRYGEIYVSTGPEELVLKNLASRLGFWVFAVLFRRRILLNIRNVSRYVSSPLLKAAYHRVGVRIFENSNNMNYANDALPTRSPSLVVPTRFSKFTRCNCRASEEISIGLLGAVDLNRRDYSFLSLVSASSQLKKAIRFIIMGRCSGSNFDLLRERYPEVSFLYFGSVLDAKEFDLAGITADYFLAPLNRTLHSSPSDIYGLSKGTGCYGDAIRFSKMLIVPGFLYDSFFSEFLITYDDSSGLILIFKRILERSCGFSNISANFSPEFFFKELEPFLTPD